MKPHLPRFYIFQGVIASAIVMLLLGVSWLGYNYYLNPHKTCRSFLTQKAAQRWSDAHKEILDRDRDGVACENLR